MRLPRGWMVVPFKRWPQEQWIWADGYCSAKSWKKGFSHCNKRVVTSVPHTKLYISQVHCVGQTDESHLLFISLIVDLPEAQLVGNIRVHIETHCWGLCLITETLKLQVSMSPPWLSQATMIFLINRLLKLFVLFACIVASCAFPRVSARSGVEKEGQLFPEEGALTSRSAFTARKLAQDSWIDPFQKRLPGRGGPKGLLNGWFGSKQDSEVRLLVHSLAS